MNDHSTTAGLSEQGMRVQLRVNGERVDREVLVRARAANREQTKELLENIADVIAAMDADLKQPTSKLLTHHSAQNVAFVRQSLLSLAAYTRQVDRAGTKDQGGQSETPAENAENKS
nr:hypothetical protein [Betaproteobacteria bacterium]